MTFLFSRPSSAARRPRQDGFTLVELLVTVAVMAILMALAAPSFNRTMAANRMSSQTNDLIASMKEARSEAARRGAVVAVRSDLGTGSFKGGWKVFVGDGTEAADNSTPVVSVRNDIAAGITVDRVTPGSGGSYALATGDEAAYVTFAPRGRSTAAFFRICSTAQRSLPGRIVQLTTAGKVAVVSTTASCA